MGNYRGEEIHVPFSSLLPMVHPNDFVLGGWDISGAPPAGAAVQCSGRRRRRGRLPLQCSEAGAHAGARRTTRCSTAPLRCCALLRCSRRLRPPPVPQA